MGEIKTGGTDDGEKARAPVSTRTVMAESHKEGRARRPRSGRRNAASPAAGQSSPRAARVAGATRPIPDQLSSRAEEVARNPRSPRKTRVCCRTRE